MTKADHCAAKEKAALITLSPATGIFRGLGFDLRPARVARGIFFEGSDSWLLLFLLSSISIQMVLGQEDVIVRFSPIYWALVVPAAVIPCWSLREIIKVLLSLPGLAVFTFLVSAGSYYVARGDFQTVAQLCFLVWVTAWCGCESIRIATADLVKIFLATIVLGTLVAILTDHNPWGLIPGHTLPEYGIWRVSFFPHVANSGIFALVILMILTRDSREARLYKAALVLGIYFILFGFVRTVLVAAGLYLFLQLLFALTRAEKPSVLFFSSIVVAVASIVGELSIAPALEVLQSDPLISRLFLRGGSGLDPSAIYEQLYRPWLWKEHLSIFITSPHYMGLGSFRLLDHVTANLVPGLDAAGSESFPTRLLAVYGLPALLFFAYLIARLWRCAQSKDAWACACFPAILFLMLNWGSVFHPTNAFFVLFLLLFKGSRAIIEHSPILLEETRSEPGVGAMCKQCDG